MTRPLRGRALIVDMVAALMWEPRTAPELAERCGCSEEAARKTLREMRRSGVIWRCARRRGASGMGKPMEVFALQTTPFGNEDIA